MRYYGHFQLAHELKQQLHCVMGWTGPMTHRQFIAWQEWLSMQLNVPDRHDFYTMQLTAVVRSIVAKNPKDVTIDKQKLIFSDGDSPPPRKHSMTKEQATHMSKYRFALMLHAQSEGKFPLDTLT